MTPVATPLPFLPWPYLDSMHDYVPLLRGPLGTLPPEARTKRVAIIGAGAAGLVAAHELLKVGVTPTVFEASERHGGRLYTRHFTEADGSPAAAFAELGAMRFPPSARVFFDYAQAFGLTLQDDFPDPGLVDTLLHYENQSHFWPARQTVPHEFGEVQRNWESFIGPLVRKIHAPWRAGDLATVQRIWQSYLSRYQSTSFYEALHAESAVWTDEDLDRFGSLGIGTGGMGPLYGVAFTEILRIVLHAWEKDQKLVANGAGALTDGFVQRRVDTPLGPRSLEECGALRLGVEIVEVISRAGGSPELCYRHGPHGPIERERFDAVVVATTTRAMQLMGLTLPAWQGGSAVAPAVRTVMRHLHHLSSSKLFIRTATKFWRGTHLPRVMLTDELPRAVYLLDYPHTEDGVVCMSYSWGDDSVKLLALDLPEQFEIIKRTVRRIHPELGDALKPVNDEVLAVSWELEPHYHGGFKLNLPGQDDDVRELYFQFLSALSPETDSGVYLAGDSVSWSGGWVEGALHTGLNAACAVIHRLGGELPPGSPLEQRPHRYHYL